LISRIAQIFVFFIGCPKAIAILGNFFKCEERKNKKWKIRIIIEFAI